MSVVDIVVSRIRIEVPSTRPPMTPTASTVPTTVSSVRDAGERTS